MPDTEQASLVVYVRMKWVERIAMSLICLGALSFCLCFAPSSEVIAGPKIARLAVRPENVPLKAAVFWSDHTLSNDDSFQTVDFDGTGTAHLPDYRIQTNLGRRILKHGLGLFGIILGCDHCDAPRVSVLVDQPPYLESEGFWLTQSESLKGHEVIFKTYLTVQEHKQPTRPFATSDSAGLLNECSSLITKGDRVFVPPAEWGPLLKEVAPLRVEIKRGTALLWMGGDIGYAVPARRAGHRSIGSVDVLPTKYPEVIQIKRRTLSWKAGIRSLPGAAPRLPALPVPPLPGTPLKSEP